MKKKTFSEMLEDIKRMGNPKDFPKNWGKMEYNNMKNKLSKQQQIDIVAQFTVHGVPRSLLKDSCRKAHISYPKLMLYLYGQTMGLVGGEGIVYPWDIERFINGLPCMD